MTPRKTPDSLAVREAIRDGRIPPVWLWSGPESWLKAHCFDLLVDRLGAGTESLNTNRYRGGVDPLDLVLATCLTLPMLSERRVVLLTDIEKLSRSERETLEGYVGNPSPETALVLAGERGPRDPLHSRMAVAGAEHAVFWVPFEEQTRQWIRIRFQERGKQCPDDLARELFERCEGGFGRQTPLKEIAPEVEKIVLAMGDRKTVHPEDLAVIGRKADDGLLNEVMGRVTARDLPGALRALDGALLFKDNTEIRILAGLTHRLLGLLRIRELRDQGLSPEEVRRGAGVWPSLWNEASRGSRLYDLGTLRRGLTALAEADRTLKSTSQNPRVVLEKTIVTICDR